MPSISLWLLDKSLSLSWPSRFVKDCLLFHILATFNVISGFVPTIETAHWWKLHSAAPMGKDANRTIAWYPTQSHLSRHWANQSLPYPNNAEWLAKKRHVSILKSLLWVDQGLYAQGSDSLFSQNKEWTLYSFDYLNCCAGSFTKESLTSRQTSIVKPRYNAIIGIHIMLPRKQWAVNLAKSGFSFLNYLRII